MEALGLASTQLQPAIRRATARFDLELEFTARVDSFITRIERSHPEILFVDTGLLAGLQDLRSFACSQCSAVKIFAIAWYWSEADERLSAHVDGILRKPPRREHWEAVLGAAEIRRFATLVPRAPRVALEKHAS